MGRGGYGNVEFWDDYYVTDRPEPYDWFFSCAHLAPLLLAVLPDKSQEILMVGCGNAPFSEEMYDLGYTNQVNVDNCALVIEQQQVRAPHMAWEVADVRSMAYTDNRFDIVLDKGLLDNLYCYQDPEENCTRALADMYRVLRPGGALLVISCHDEAEVHASLRADPAWAWDEVRLVRLRNPRFPEVRVKCHVFVIAVKVRGAAPGVRGGVTAGAAAEPAPAKQPSSAAAESSYPFPSEEVLAGLVSPEDGLPIIVGEEEVEAMARRIEVMNEASKAAMVAAQEAAAANRAAWAAWQVQQDAWVAQQQAQQAGGARGAGAGAVEGGGAAEGGGGGAAEGHGAAAERAPAADPPNGTLAQQLVRRRASLARAPPLQPPRPLALGDGDGGDGCGDGGGGGGGGGRGEGGCSGGGGGDGGQ